MRAISDLERKIIDRICSGYTHISTLLLDSIPDLILDIDLNAEEPVTLVLPEEDSDLVTTATNQTEKIIYIIKFLLYLEVEGYALTGYFAPGRTITGKFTTLESLSKLNSSPNSYTHWKFTDKEIQNLILKYANKDIMPTYQLRAFKDRGYRTQEEKRHIQILWISCIAIITSLLLGLFSVYQNYSSKQNTATRQQVESIENYLRSFKLPQDLPTGKQVDSLIQEVKVLTTPQK